MVEIKCEKCGNVMQLTETRKRKMKTEERLKKWEKQEELTGTKKCDCGFGLVLHKTRNNNEYFVCSLCNKGYTKEGKFLKGKNKWSREDFE